MAKIVKSALKSGLLNREIPYRVILPESYFETKQNLPVIYLLHGLFGNCDNWLELTEISDLVSKKDLIIILPEGEESWYCNSEIVETQRFESYLIEELLPEIDASFRTKIEKRVIIGLSMGGYGALKFGLKYPDLFIFCGSMSGALMAPQLTRANCPNDWQDLLPSIKMAFGRVKGPTRIDNDLFKIVTDKTAEEISRLPFFYLDCGKDDSFLGINRKFAALMEIKDIPHFYREVHGGHDWNYWNRQIKEVLQFAEKEFEN